MPIVPPLPFTLLNGTTADATQVMADLLSMFTSINNYAAPLANAYLTDPNFTDPISTGGTFTNPILIGGSIDGTTTGVTAPPLANDVHLSTNEYVDKAVTAAHKITGLITAGPNITLTGSGTPLSPYNISSIGWLSNITGLITAGSNVIITGSGTSLSPYNISSTGGGSSGVQSVVVKNISSNTNPGITIPPNSIVVGAFAVMLTSILAPNTLTIGIDNSVFLTLGSAAPQTQTSLIGHSIAWTHGISAFSQTFAIQETSNWFNGGSADVGLLYVTVP